MTDPTITAAAHTVYDSESGRWCCTVCEQWSDEDAGDETIDHLDQCEATTQPATTNPAGGSSSLVVGATDQPSEDQPPIRLDLESETEPSSVVICQSHGQASPFYVCLREATATWRTTAGRTLSLCDEHGEYAAAEGWTADQPTEVADDGQP